MNVSERGRVDTQMKNESVILNTDGGRKPEDPRRTHAGTGEGDGPHLKGSLNC